MKKRVICLLLSAVILLSLLPGAALKASAASEMKTSDDAIAILKKFEGFIPKPVYDHGQYSVGYGSGCNKGDYPNGITEEEADALLRKHLAGMEKSVNYFLDRYSLSLKQHQFDALMLFTYNVGANWINADGEFRQAVIDGAAGNDLIYPLTLWSNASSQLQVHLVKRRLAEANLYLNGVYSVSKPANYSYVVYENNGGVGNVKVQGYDATLSAVPQPAPYRTGYRFMGWYTAEEGGSWVTSLTASNAEKTLYAHWQQGSGDAVNGTAASYQRTANQISTLDIHSAPGSSEITGKVDANATVTIVADYVDGSNVKWGKLSGGGWVNLGNALIGIVTNHAAQDPVNVIVTNSYINVRSGPNTTYEKVGTVNYGDKLEIVETRLVGSDMWGRFSGGWISLMYTNYESAKEDASTDSGTVIATGTVVNCSSLRIRSGAGTNYPVLGSLSAGTKVEITQQKTGSGMTWGRIASGWISLSYVSLDTTNTAPEESPETQPAPDTNTGSSGTESTQLTVTVTNSYINVRSGPNTTYAKVGTVYYGQQLVLTETKLMGQDMWGKFSDGWVSLMYTNYDKVKDTAPTPEPETPAAPETPEAPETENPGTSESITVTVTNSYINVRSGPNTTYAKVGTVYYGQQLVLTETRMMGQDMWGKFSSGWVSLMYTNYNAVVGGGSSSAAPDTGVLVTGTVTTTDPLNIRTGAGTNNTQIGTYTNGTKISIYEYTSVGGVLWGKTDRGWVCLTYVKLDGTLPQSGATQQPETEPAPETQPEAPPETTPDSGSTENTEGTNATVICNDTLNIRSEAGTFNPQVGSFVRGTRITVYEQKFVNGQYWGRTDKGWVCMSYVQMDSDTAEANFTGIVNTDGLRIRSGAGSHHKILGYYNTGDQVRILETTSVAGGSWGRTDQGWICLDYVNKT